MELLVRTLNKSFKSSNSSSRMPNSSWSTLQMYSVISLLAFMVFFTWGSSVSGRPGWVLWLPDKHILLAEVTIWTRPDLWYFFYLINFFIGLTTSMASWRLISLLAGLLLLLFLELMLADQVWAISLRKIVGVILVDIKIVKLNQYYDKLNLLWAARLQNN